MRERKGKWPRKPSLTLVEWFHDLCRLSDRSSPPREENAGVGSGTLHRAATPSPPGEGDPQLATRETESNSVYVLLRGIDPHNPLDLIYGSELTIADSHTDTQYTHTHTLWE